MPESLIPVIADCLDKDPSKRPSARDLLLRLVDPSVANRRPIADTGPPGPDDLAARTGPVPWMAGATASDFGPGQLATGPAPGREAGLPVDRRRRAEHRHAEQEVVTVGKDYGPFGRKEF